MSYVCFVSHFFCRNAAIDWLESQMSLSVVYNIFHFIILSSVQVMPYVSLCKPFSLQEIDCRESQMSLSSKVIDFFFIIIRWAQKEEHGCVWECALPLKLLIDNENIWFPSRCSWPLILYALILSVCANLVFAMSDHCLLYVTASFHRSKSWFRGRSYGTTWVQ